MHGTWAAPRHDMRQWYQHADDASAADRFVEKLDSELRKRGSAARSWAHCNDGAHIFHWSGENSWIARAHAAAKLADYVAKLQKDGWLCHIVAHSHGGNVALDAVQQIFAPVAERCGMFVALGTPFLDTMSPIFKSAHKARVVLKFSSAIMAALLTCSIVAIFLLTWQHGILGDIALLFAFSIALFGLILAVHSFHMAWIDRRTESNSFGIPWKQTLPDVPESFLRVMLQKPLQNCATKVPLRPRMLALGSSMDETWQILHHLRSIENPLVSKQRPLDDTSGTIWTYMSDMAEIARLHGAKSYRDVGWFGRCCLALLHLLLLAIVMIASSAEFNPSPSSGLISSFISHALPFALLSAFVFSLALLGSTIFGPSFYQAFLSPLQWCFRLIGFFKTIPTRITTYIVRRKGWLLLLAIAMGMEGYRFKLPLVERSPRRLPDWFVKYEDMPVDAERRAIKKRDEWIARHLGSASQTFANMVVTTADVAILLDTIERDQSLVHAAYYTDDECIARIADWIAGVG